MDKIPEVNTPEKPDILQRIDNIRLIAVKGENPEELSDAIYHYDVSLKEKYTKEELWAVPAWHKLIGSSQQAEYIDTGKSEEISELIEEFVTEWENR